VNRGPDSRRTIDLLLGLPDARFIRGNHDDIFDQILSGAAYAPNASKGDPRLAFRWFMQYGLDRTLLSYGADLIDLDRLTQRPSAAGLSELLRCVPQAHRQFIHNLPASIDEPDLFVRHGKWDIDSPDALPIGGAIGAELPPATRSILLWERYTMAEVVAKKAWRRIGYFGHTPVELYEPLLKNGELRPIVGPKIVLVDTACAVSPMGRLTAYCHETRSYIQVDRFGEPVDPS
jgi:hypothetical protein